MNRGRLSRLASLRNRRARLADLAVIACQTGRGPLNPRDDQIRQFGRHLWRITERSDDVIVVIEPGTAAKGLPERIRVRVSRQHGSYRSIARLSMVCLITV